MNDPENLLDSLETREDLDFDAPPPEAAAGKRPPINKDLGLPPNLRAVTRGKHAARDLTREMEALDHLISLPREGETLHLIIQGNYSGFDLIVAMQKLLGHPISLTASTLSMNLDNAQRLIEMIDAGKVLHANLILSELFAGKDCDLFAVVRDRLQARGQHIIASRTHAKVACLATQHGQFFTLEGSGNLRSCVSIEQMTVTNSRELWEFHTEWMQHLLSRA